MQVTELWWLNGHAFELETARVMYELGIVGFILVYATRVSLIFVALGMMSRLKRPLFKALSAGIATYFIPQLFLFVINNPTGGLYFWFAAGLLYAMHKHENEALAGQHVEPSAVPPGTALLDGQPGSVFAHRFPRPTWKNGSA